MLKYTGCDDEPASVLSLFADADVPEQDADVVAFVAFVAFATVVVPLMILSTDDFVANSLVTGVSVPLDNFNGFVSLPVVDVVAVGTPALR